MANHVRQQIREAIGTLLTGLTTTGARVYQSRVFALTAATELPCILIYTLQEATSREDSFCQYVRRITVAVEAVAEPTANVDDVLDTICKEVEAKMATNKLLSGLATDVVIQRTDVQLQGGDSERTVGAARMSWEVLTITLEGAPDVAL